MEKTIEIPQLQTIEKIVDTPEIQTVQCTEGLDIAQDLEMARAERTLRIPLKQWQKDSPPCWMSSLKTFTSQKAFLP